MRSETAWSYLDPKPVCLYDPKFDAHLVYWNGIGMTRSYALIIYCIAWMNSYPPESQKQAAWIEYNRIYRLGGFQTRAWDRIIDSYDHSNFHSALTSYISKKNPKFLYDLKDKFTAKEAFEWFMPSKELTSK